MTGSTLILDDLVVSYPRRRAEPLKAVAGVSLQIGAGETVALIGESGSGKSTLARAICGLVPKASGAITFGGLTLGDGRHAARRSGAAGIQMVVQDSSGALNPRWPIWRAVTEPARLARGLSPAECRTLAAELLDTVALSAGLLDKSSRHLSGGQRQRVNIARTLAADPKLVVLDEAVSALDISVRNEILHLLDRLKRERDLTYLFITHDMGAVTQIATQVAVLYLGRIVEFGPVEQVVGRPRHPYSQALIAAVPVIGGRRGGASIRGEVDDPGDPPPGCRFPRRCRHATEVCSTEVPLLSDYDRRLVACHHVGEINEAILGRIR